MKLTGARTFNASASRIWDLLMDTEALARITPGISRLEATGPDTYRAIADVKIGPVSGSFTGKVDLLEKNAPQGFTLHVEQNSKIGNVSADIRLELDEKAPGQTELRFDGLANMSGLLARTGQRVMSGVANTLTEQFFKALEAELQTPPA
ncbi:MAG: hypothetical protein RL181_2095 [Bacteroidota bacterium]